jgi:ABC-2 type transport system permease protein
MSFYSFLRKEFFHIFRDKRTMLILLAMPIVLIVLFGFALSTDVKNIDIGVFNPANDIEAQQIVQQLDASEFFVLKRTFRSPSEIDEAFRNGDIKLALVFSENLSKNSLRIGGTNIQLIADASDPNQALTLTGYAANIIQSGDWAGDAVPRNSQIVIAPQVKMLYNPQMKSAFSFVPGVMGLIMMLICAMMTSVSIVREKEMGTMEVLLVSPMRPLNIILVKVIPYFLLSIVNLATILLLSVFVLQVPVSGSLFWLIIISILFISTALALGMLISNVVNTQVAAMLLSAMVLLMPSMMLSGMIFPVKNMPPILQWLSCVIPARWYIEAVRKLMIQGVDVIYVLREMLVLAGMTIVFLTISLKKFKIRLN